MSRVVPEQFQEKAGVKEVRMALRNIANAYMTGGGPYPRLGNPLLIGGAIPLDRKGEAPTPPRLNPLRTAVGKMHNDRLAVSGQRFD